jgi:hypothetical protein
MKIYFLDALVDSCNSYQKQTSMDSTNSPKYVCVLIFVGQLILICNTNARTEQ